MPSIPTHDIVIKVGEYTDGQGAVKARTKNIGTMFMDQDGRPFLAIDATILQPSLLLIANREMKERVFLSLYEKREQGQQGHGAATAPAAASMGQQTPPAQGYGPPQGGQRPQTRQQQPHFDDDIPF